MYTPIVGLEIHVELSTKSKMFCGCAANYFGQKPNTYTCPVCLGLPGALPVPNRRAIESCIMIGQALGCTIADFAKFDRKNYFYPDLSKGYQISQYDEPFCTNGKLTIKIPDLKNKIAREKTIRIRRVHMEEDTGKLIHATVDGKPCTLIDFNRCGVPLVEIVTEADIRSSEEARIFLKELHQIIRYLDVSDADMEKGSMRLEPNISIAKLKDPESYLADKDLPKYKVEVKNINSFGFVKKAIDYEVIRHEELLENGQTPKQETRGWDEKKAITYAQRSKEEAHDYRYFPEPDIPPFTIDQALKTRLQLDVDTLLNKPKEQQKRDVEELKIRVSDSITIRSSVEASRYFDQLVEIAKQHNIPNQAIANMIVNKKIDIKGKPDELIQQLIVKQQKPQMDTGDLDAIIQKVIESNPKAVADYKGGKEGTIMFLVGLVMKESKGKADATTVKQLLQKSL